MNRLRSCDGCARHVFVSERVCPFCMTELAPAVQRAALPVPSGASRAQRLALAAALGSQSLLACAETRQPEPPVAVPVYGAPLAGNQGPPPAGSAPPAAGRGGGARPDAGFAVPVYGVPLAGQPSPVPPPPKQPDAGTPPEDDAGTAPTAGSGGRGGMAVPVYGAPVPEYGAPPPPKD